MNARRPGGCALARRRGPRAAAVLCAALVLAAPLLGAAPAPKTGAAPAVPAAKATPAAAKLKVTRLKFVVGHRVFTEFRDVVTAKLHESFRVGDSEYSAKVVEFQPDFAMDLKTRKVISRSQKPSNPAARVIVWKNGAPDDTTWAFLNMPPHFGRNSMLAFRLTRVEFENHPPVDAPADTAARVRPGTAR